MLRQTTQIAIEVWWHKISSLRLAEQPETLNSSRALACNWSISDVVLSYDCYVTSYCRSCM